MTGRLCRVARGTRAGVVRVVLAAALVAPSAAAVGSAPERVTDQVIRFHQSRVAADPLDPLAYNRLAAAYVQKARESGDIAYYGLAEAAARRAVELGPRAPSAVEAHVLLAVVHLARHEFSEALARARTALELNPADAAAHTVAGDALVELGDYAEAARQYARVSAPDGPRRPLARLAYLQYLHGDLPGAIRTMREAAAELAAMHPTGEPATWARTQLGDLLFQAGDLPGAEKAYREALAALPGYHRAVAGSARVLAARGRYAEAVEGYRKALAVIPLPEYAAALGDVHMKLGRREDAARQYALVEYIGRLSALNKTVYNRELALFWADRDVRLPEALELARRELEVRRDIYTYDVLAWALYKNGRAAEARAAMIEARRLGTQDARLFFHAAMIHRALGERDQARDELRRALALNPHFDLLQADVARRELAALTGPP